MEKIGVVIVALNPNAISQALSSLNLNNALPVAVLSQGGDGKIITFGNLRIQMFSFSSIQQILNRYKNFAWLICGVVWDVGDIYKMKKLLVSAGVPENNIVNFEILSHITKEWVANLRYIEKNPVDCFATGISYTEAGLNFNCIAGVKGVNLASSNQDLRQSYITAKYVFDHAKRGSFKFVLIGLTPYSLRYDNIKSFSVCPRNLQYAWTLNDSTDDTPHGKLLQRLVSDEVKNNFLNTPVEQADLNFDGLKNRALKEFPAYALVGWQEALKNSAKDFYPDTFEKNLQILEDYIKLCLENHAKPVGIMFPFAPAMRDNYDKNLLVTFRQTVRQLEKIYDFKFIDMFDLPLDYSCFYNMPHLNLKGSILAGNVLNARLCEQNILPPENLCRYSYEYFYTLSNILPKDEYNNFMSNVFKMSLKKLRRKNKINIAFVLYDSSMWCGDEIYKSFAKDKRYEPTVFLCLRQDKLNMETTVKDFYHGVEQLKAKGLNVVSVVDKNAAIPRQDVFIFLTPYLEVLPTAFSLANIPAETLLTYIPYGLVTATWDTTKNPLLHVVWKIFFETEFSLREHEQNAEVENFCGHYSGHPKMDIFFDDKADFKYDWKMAQPNSRKIIWAPHFSIREGIKYSTFHYNYQFMYEYARAHPEISWVVKPHPNLLFSAVEAGLFPSVKAFEEYLQKWNDLPNAKVETGAYYQAIFATSDGMILDSGSFISEYQYVHKPMIFLTRDTQKFNSLGDEIMKIIYRVDGKNFQGIAELMQKIFIEGRDEMFEERMKFFDRYLNYKQANKMLASAYIFKSIAQDLK